MKLPPLPRPSPLMPPLWSAPPLPSEGLRVPLQTGDVRNTRIIRSGEMKTQPSYPTGVPFSCMTTVMLAPRRMGFDPSGEAVAAEAVVVASGVLLLLFSTYSTSRTAVVLLLTKTAKCTTHLTRQPIPRGLMTCTRPLQDRTILQHGLDKWRRKDQQTATASSRRVIPTRPRSTAPSPRRNILVMLRFGFSFPT